MSSALAGSMEVAPTTLILGNEQARGAVWVANRGKTRIAFEVQALEWTQTDGQETLVETSDIRFSPPIATVAPGQKQTVRFSILPSRDLSRERTFRILVSELPIPAEAQAPQVAVVLQFSIPVFQRPASCKPASLSHVARVSEGRLKVTTSNAGCMSAKILSLSAKSAGRADMALIQSGLSYVLPGATRTYEIEAAGLKPGERIEVSARTEVDGILPGVDVKLDP